MSTKLSSRKKLINMHRRELSDRARPPESLDLQALRDHEVALLTASNSTEKEYSELEVLSIEIRQLFCMMEEARSLLGLRTLLPTGTHTATTVQATLKTMKDRLSGLLEDRNTLSEATQELTMDDLRNKDSWFWSEELQELEETGINESIRRYIDFDQKSQRIREEESLLVLERENFNRNVAEVIGRLQAVEPTSNALQKYKRDKLALLNSWIII
jgi:hypothetical protein